MAARYKAIFVDVDTQFDFMDPQGALYVPGAQQIVPNLQRLLGAAVEHNIPIISSADSHTPDDPEFNQYNFPPHCVRGTTGQQKIPQTLLATRATIEPDEYVDDLAGLLERHQQLVFHKRVFEIWSNPNAVRLLQQVEADGWYVFGVATDYCVKAAALGLTEAGKPTFVVSDAVKPVTPEGEKEAVEHMQARGIKLITTDEVLEVLQAR